MLKDLIKTLANWDWFYSNSVRDEFSYLVKDVKIHTWYALKFEINRNKFREYFCDNVNYDLFVSEISETNKINLCYDYLNQVGQKWYEFMLDNKSLVDKTSSLKSESKRWYKQNISKELKGFDRFMEMIFKLYNEAYNIYEIVFYSADAIEKNIVFSADRGSCYINSRKDYLTVIKQLPSFYVMIYRNKKPITRVWAVLDKNLRDIVIFNQYGYEFKKLWRMFGLEEEFKFISSDSLEERLGIYINSGDWLVSKDAILDTFIYNVHCPTCGTLTKTNELEWEEGLRCYECINKGRVWSNYNEAYIDEEEACWSEIYQDYFYSDQVVYSYYYDDYILEKKAYYVYNLETDGMDYVLDEDAVYSEYAGEWVIKSQCVYSEYYDSYILHTKDVVYSRWLDTYVYINDNDIIIIDDDEYVPVEDLPEYIERNSIKKLKTV